jgi:hypothetical protein
LEDPNERNFKNLINVAASLSDGILYYSIQYFDNIHMHLAIEKLGGRFLDILHDLK